MTNKEYKILLYQDEDRSYVAECVDYDMAEYFASSYEEAKSAIIKYILGHILYCLKNNQDPFIESHDSWSSDEYNKSQSGLLETNDYIINNENFQLTFFFKYIL